MEYIISLEGPITHGRVVLKLFLDQSLGQADYMDWFSRQLCVVRCALCKGGHLPRILGRITRDGDYLYYRINCQRPD